jgi:dipeptidyl-peptidase-4
MDELNAMKNTNQYTVLNFDRASRSSQIDLYDFATLEKVSTLLSSKDFPQLQGIDSYTFNKKENQILIANNSEQIFRHSAVSDYFLYDIASKSLTKIAEFKNLHFRLTGLKLLLLTKTIYMYTKLLPRKPNKSQPMARKIAS